MDQLRKENLVRRNQLEEQRNVEDDDVTLEGSRLVARKYLRWLTRGKPGGSGDGGDVTHTMENILTAVLHLLPEPRYQPKCKFHSI